MNIQLDSKKIKEACGLVSFRKGDSFYRSKKVVFSLYEPEYCEADVMAAEDFHVIIQGDGKGGYHADCSCPRLASVKTDCQHIAAVLLAILDHQKKGTVPLADVERAGHESLAESLLTIFEKEHSRSSGEQLHFEDRQPAEASFSCMPVSLADGSTMLGIEASIDLHPVRDIRKFLMDVKERSSSAVSPFFTYEPAGHYFRKEDDAVLQELMRIIEDEQAHKEGQTLEAEPSILLIPPTSWRRLLSLLTAAPMVQLKNKGQVYEGISLPVEPLPLSFRFELNEDKGGRLVMKGMDKILILQAYQSVLYRGMIYQLENEDCKRLADLKGMLSASGTDRIPIQKEQVGFLLEKVVPGLKKLGEVHLPGGINTQLIQSPLTAKLYLDRLKNRLLASLEFQYDNVVFNPLEEKEFHTDLLLIRDEEKERSILEVMEESSFARTDSGYYLQNEELEYEFLYRQLPKLQTMVKVYATTAIRNRIFRESIHPRISVKVKKERTNWLEFKFAMDGIPEHEVRGLLASLEEKRKYYRLRDGALLSLESREFDEIRRFLNEIPAQDEDLEEGLNVPMVPGLRLMGSLEEGEVFSFEDSFRNFIKEVRTPGSRQFAVPESLEHVLRDYQKQGYQWLKTLAGYGFGGILADDMGLGKTLQAIAYILSELPAIRRLQQPALIVCPSSLTYNWQSEFERFAPEIKSIVMDGSKSEREKMLAEAGDLDVLIVSYPLLRKDISSYEKQPFSTVFFDEAQAFKNPVTQTARTVKRLQAGNRFALTGTPIENSLEELWSIFHVIFPELFQGLREFSFLDRKTISRRTSLFLLRRLKSDVLSELPEKTEYLESAELLPDQKKLYAAYLAKLRHDTLKHLDKDTLRKNKIRILAGLTRLRQICCHPALFVDGYKGSSAKYEQLLQIIKESRLSGRRVLIFSQFTKMLDMIGRELARQGIGFFYLDGQTPSEERVKLCGRFNSGEHDFFLISLKAGGTGLNLTGADTVILYDLWWNPAVENQAADRAYRMGQRHNVQVIKLLARGTIEEKMNELQDKKRNLIEEVIEPGGKSQGMLTEDDIREILNV
ncbi:MULTISPECIES: DEAD/DEAH box helicase [Bacillus]|uniref:Helicase SNF n=1 Tax=Bacillus infantis NRRL B-14911 TaxID=1367477 RepID=U5L6L0_9BACI|nr:MULTISPECIES: DEAD/DEAH box helicase [Bacillus]AGX02386.1 helicase SNF [Bacillus infantis NRRL B-14911]